MGSFSDAFVWRLSTCPSVAYIGPKSRTERPRQTKIGTEVAHVTLDSDTTFEVKRSRSPGRFTQRGLNAWDGWSADRENVLSVRNYCYVTSARRRVRRLGADGGRRGAGAYRVATRTAGSQSLPLPDLRFSFRFSSPSYSWLTSWIVNVRNRDHPYELPE